MNDRRIGLWLIGACGGVGSTVALGLATLRRDLTDTISLVTALPEFAGLKLDDFAQFVIGGHDIRQTSLRDGVQELHKRARVFDATLIERCLPDLESWNQNVRPGIVLNAGPAIMGLADTAQTRRVSGPREAIAAIQKDLQEFRDRNHLDQLVVVNVASTEPPYDGDDSLASLTAFTTVLQRPEPPQLPASALYAWAALDLGLPYVNFTPSLGASFPAIQELAQQRRAVFAGKDGKTGETLLKTVLAPMFARRNWEILSWVGHNIFGNRDGQVLDRPENKASKIRTKDQVISSIVGYRPQTHVSIEYIESLDDWKTAWDHIHFRGFLDTRMILQFTWQGCDSLLAAPLVIDLARLALHAQRSGEVGVMRHLACFFKSPMGVEEHDFAKQFAMLEEYIKKHTP